MPASFLIRFRPTGPWRFGPDSGSREHVDPLLHSDAVYSAVTAAMAQLGSLEEWLEATAKPASGAPAVRFSSLYPYQRDLLFVVPPRSVWPPTPSSKIRYKGARMVPLAMVEALLTDKPLDEDRWSIDGESACLVPANWQEGPFRKSLRSNAGVDRLSAGHVGVHATACLEFTRESGLWLIAQFEDEAAQARWEQPLRSALRLLADSGIGGERGRGWGRSREPKWDASPTWDFPAETEGIEPAWWLLSLYAPGATDAVDWQRGSYSALVRTGRAESLARWGEPKAPTNMVAEGSVVFAAAQPLGSVSDVAPAGFPHPVYRSGFAVSLPIPWRVTA